MLNLRLRQVSVRPVNLRDAYKQPKLVSEGASIPTEMPMKSSTNKAKQRRKMK